MAKKGRAKAAKAAKAKAAEKKVVKKKSNTLLYALGVLILIVIIVLIIRSGGMPTKETPEVQVPTTPAETPGINPAVTEMADEPYCKEGAAIGVKPGFCKDQAGNVEFTLTHLGTDTLSGVKYFTLDENGNILKQDFIMEQLPGNSDKTYKVTVDPATLKIEVRAILSIGGVDKVCTNQRILAPLRNC